MVSQSRFQYTGRLETNIYRLRFARRDFVSGERSVSASVSLIDAVDAAGHAAPGFVIKIQTWTVLTELPSQSGDASKTTLIQTYTTITPVTFREPCAYRWEKELVEKFVIPEWECGMAAGHQRLENALIAQATC